MKKIYKTKIGTSILLFSVQIALAQRWEIGLSGGATNMRTDVANFNWKNTQYGGLFFVRYNFNETWVLRTEYKQLRIGSSDVHSNSLLSELRNHAFRNQIREVSINLEYNFLNYRSADKRIVYSPFLTAGLGYFRFSDYEYGSRIGQHNVSLPLGVGIKYLINRHLNTGLVFSASKTFNDRIDNISLHSPGSYSEKIRGSDPSTKDWFYYLGITLSYTFYAIECPEFYDL